jgi:molybdopterin synthase catalytic subunit
MIEITTDDFSIDEVVQNTRRPSMGAVVLFLGTTRDITEGKSVLKLEFESDTEAAVAELKTIRNEAISKFDVTDVSIVHRIGTMIPGENIVLIAAGAAHRNQAFKACRYAIDELKKRAMIWKKEYIGESSYWVGSKDIE